MEDREVHARDGLSVSVHKVLEAPRNSDESFPHGSLSRASFTERGRSKRTRRTTATSSALVLPVRASLSVVSAARLRVARVRLFVNESGAQTRPRNLCASSR